MSHLLIVRISRERLAFQWLRGILAGSNITFPDNRHSLPRRIYATESGWEPM